MTELVDETTGEIVEEAEPDTGEPDEELTPDDDEPDDEPEGDEPEAERQQAPVQRDERWWEQAWNKAEKENDRHTKRVSEIFEDEAVNLIPCPMCATSAAGWLTGTRFEDEHRALIDKVLGVESLDDYKPMDGAALCDKCDGMGTVKTPSKVPEQQLLMCESCMGAGWRRVAGPNDPGIAPAYVPPPVASADGSGQIVELPDAWGRPPGHRHYNIPPADVL